MAALLAAFPCTSQCTQNDADESTPARQELQQERLVAGLTKANRVQRGTPRGGGLRNEFGDCRRRDEAAASDDNAGEFATIQQSVDRVSGNSAEEFSRFGDRVKGSIFHDT